MIQHSCLIFGWSVDQSLKETITQQHAILTHTHFHNPNRHTHGHTNRRRSFLLWYPLIYKAALISNISIFYTKCLSCSWWPNMEKKWKFLPSCVILHKYENYWGTQTCDQTLKCRQIPKDSFCKKGKQEFWKKELLTGQTFVVQVGWCWAHVAEDPWKYKKWQVCVCVCLWQPVSPVRVQPGGRRSSPSSSDHVRQLWSHRCWGRPARCSLHLYPLFGDWVTWMRRE